MKMLYSLAVSLALLAPAQAADLTPFNPLFPTGENNYGWQGATPEGLACSASFSRGEGFVSILLTVSRKGGGPALRHGKFQVGFGHTLSFVMEQDRTLRAASSHRAEEQYSSDTRALTVVELSDEGPASVLIKNETKRFLGYETEFFERCVKAGV